jgi:hypothetical protein
MQSNCVTGLFALVSDINRRYIAFLWFSVGTGFQQKPLYLSYKNDTQAEDKQKLHL